MNIDYNYYKAPVKDSNLTRLSLSYFNIQRTYHYCTATVKDGKGYL